MDYEIIELTNAQVEEIENCLNEYDKKHIPYNLSGSVRIGVVKNDKLIAGVDACIDNIIRQGRG